MDKKPNERSLTPIFETEDPGYPPKLKEDSHDRSRRRFLRQIALGGGALSLVTVAPSTR